MTNRCQRCEQLERQLDIARDQMKYHHNDGYERGWRAGIEKAAQIVDEANRTGPYNAIVCASVIRATLETPPPKEEEEKKR